MAQRRHGKRRKEVVQRTHGKSIRARAKRRRQRMQMIAGVVFGSVVLVLILIYVVISRSVSQYSKSVICDNVYIGNIDVSGMKKKEAKALLEERFEQDKVLPVTLQVGDQAAEGTLEEYGFSYKDLDKTLDKAMDYGKKGSMWSRFWKLRKLKKEKVVLPEEFRLSKEAGETVIAERAVPLADRARSATIIPGEEGFTIEKEKSGEKVKVADSLKKLEDYINDDWDHKAVAMEAVIEKEEPKVVAKDLEGIQDELGSYSTDAGSGERVQNLQTGVEKLSNIVLLPGETLSVEEMTKPYTAENGYVTGDSYEGGKVVQTFGGGLCQVSTTLYNAVLYAEIEVVERHNHSMQVSYVPPSRDAAVAEGLLDFVIRNNYEDPICIIGGIDANNQLYFAIYGKDTREEGRTVEYESEVLSTDDDTGTTYETNSDLPFGSIQMVSGSHVGAEAQLWKIVYQDGEEVSRDLFNYSSYQKTDTIYAVGTASDNAAAVAALQNAVATQDRAAIDAAINASY